MALGWTWHPGDTAMAPRSRTQHSWGTHSTRGGSRDPIPGTGPCAPPALHRPIGRPGGFPGRPQPLGRGADVRAGPPPFPAASTQFRPLTRWALPGTPRSAPPGGAKHGGAHPATLPGDTLIGGGLTPAVGGEGPTVTRSGAGVAGLGGWGCCWGAGEWLGVRGPSRWVSPSGGSRGGSARGSRSDGKPRPVPARRFLPAGGAGRGEPGGAGHDRGIARRHSWGGKLAGTPGETRTGDRSPRPGGCRVAAPIPGVFPAPTHRGAGQACLSRQSAHPIVCPARGAGLGP